MEVAQKECDVDFRCVEDIVKVILVRKSTYQNELGFFGSHGASEALRTTRVLQCINFLTLELNESVEFIIGFIEVLSGREVS